ncbi:MAG TPA: Fur family transcriptional regulator [Candidatus Paceibacterota bacterium]
MVKALDKTGIRPEHEQILVKAGYKLTKPRRLILNALYESEGLASADDIWEALKRDAVDRVTAYRTLGLFEQLGIVRHAMSRSGIKVYEVAHHHEHADHCHHAVCEGCGVTEHIDDPEIEKALELLARKLKKVKFVKDHTLEFFGECTSCHPKRSVKVANRAKVAKKPIVKKK